MSDGEDVQGTVIGVGTLAAIAFYVYGRFVGGTVFGADPTIFAIGAFAATFGALALLHGAYGRRDFAGAYALAGLGLFLVAPATSAPQTLAGLVLLLIGGVYVGVLTIRLRGEEATAKDV